ncbi:kinase-like protein [Auricularia subglabra TFB-10046 SS5]|nr:kinase-like protein [Auricularia subglabra TFB-10046 SS5]
MFKLKLYERSLGAGVYGEVIKAVDVSDGKTYAVKFTKIPTNEWKILQMLAHTTVVEGRVSFESEGFTCIVMEYASGGTLSTHGILGECSAEDCIGSALTGADEATAKCVARDVAAGLAHMHEMGIAHRDIKPDNVVFTNAARRGIKIVDFGIAIQVDDTGLIKVSSLRRGAGFKAPEVRPCRAYTPRADLWSLGVTILYW